MKRKIVVFASGGPGADDGGSGFQELEENTHTGVLNAEVAVVVSNHEHGGVRTKADKLGIPFVYMPAPYDAETYQRVIDEYHPDLICLSGWLKLIPKECIGNIPIMNIHPGLLPKFGGHKMYGHHVHEATIAAYKRGEITYTAVTMHFVNAEYDKGKIFFEYRILIRDDDTAETLQKRVNKIEHAWQSYITNLVLHGHIRMENDTLIVPEGYQFLPQAA